MLFSKKLTSDKKQVSHSEGEVNLPLEALSLLTLQRVLVWHLPQSEQTLECYRVSDHQLFCCKFQHFQLSLDTLTGNITDVLADKLNMSERLPGEINQE